MFPLTHFPMFRNRSIYNRILQVSKLRLEEWRLGNKKYRGPKCVTDVAGQERTFLVVPYRNDKNQGGLVLNMPELKSTQTSRGNLREICELGRIFVR